LHDESQIVSMTANSSLRSMQMRGGGAFRCLRFVVNRCFGLGAEEGNQDGISTRSRNLAERALLVMRPSGAVRWRIAPEFKLERKPMQKSNMKVTGVGVALLFVVAVAGGAMKLDTSSKASILSGNSVASSTTVDVQDGFDLARPQPTTPGCCIPSSGTCIENLNPRSCAQLKGYGTLDCGRCRRIHISSGDESLDESSTD